MELRSLITVDGELRLTLEHVAVAAPGPDEVVVRAEAAPLNPVPESVAHMQRLVPCATETPFAQGMAVDRNLFLKLCISEPALARTRSYEEQKITSPSRSIE